MDCVWTAAKIYWMRGWLQILTGDRACTNSKFKTTHVLNTKFSFQRILSQNFKIELASLKCKLLRKEKKKIFFSKEAPHLIPEKSNVASLKLAGNNELGSWKVQLTIHIQDSILRKQNFSEGLSVNLGCHNKLWIPQTDLHNRHLYLTIPEAEKSKVKMLVDSVYSEHYFSDLKTATFMLCPHTTERVRALIYLPIPLKDINVIMGCPPS